MKTFGRIMMLICGLALLLFAGFYFTQFINLINGFKWESLSNFVESLPSYATLPKAFFLLFFGFSALFSAIKGKASFRYFIYSALFVGICIYSVVAAKIEGPFVLNANSISLIVLPSVYLISSLILFFCNISGK